MMGSWFRRTAVTGLCLVSLGTAQAVQASGASSPRQAVTTLLAAFTIRDLKATCNAVTGRLADCPATKRFRDQVDRASRHSNAVCRCQNSIPTRIIVTVPKVTSGSVPVVTQWYFGGKPSYTMTFVVVKSHKTWRVDDQYCSGRPDTTIYTLPADPCG